MQVTYRLSPFELQKDVFFLPMDPILLSGQGAQPTSFGLKI